MSAGSAASVRIDFKLLGKRVMNNVCEAVYVKTACRNVCGHEDLKIAMAKLAHDAFALRMGKIAVESVNVVAVFHQRVCGCLGFLACSAEDNSV